ncbi:MAG TPA: AEC family transporter [Armatimonadota bacterium]
MIELVLPIFVLIGTGYVLRHYGVLDPSTSYKIVGLLMYVTYPATLFLALVSQPIPAGVWKAPLWSVVTLLASCSVTYTYARIVKLKSPVAGSLVVASSFGNTGFLGVPFLFMAYGETGRITGVFYDLIGVSMVLYGVGFAVLAAFGGEDFNWKAILLFFRTPTFITAVAALAVRSIMPYWTAWFPHEWLVGKVVYQSMHMLTPLTAPLAMICLGINLRFRALREFLPQVGVGVFAKVIVMPVVAYALVRAFGPLGAAGKATVLESAMPGGLVVGVLCGRFGCNPRLGAAITVGTTLAAMVTLPFWLGLLGR